MNLQQQHAETSPVIVERAKSVSGSNNAFVSLKIQEI